MKSLALFLLLGSLPCLAAPTLDQQIDPAEVNVGDEVTVTLTIQNGGGNIKLPPVDGLQVTSNSTSNNISIVNGSMTSSLSQIITLIPNRAGDFTIPSFDIPLQSGGTLRTKEMKLHVLASGAVPQAPTPTPNPPANVIPLPAFNPKGPVVMPPQGTAPAQADANNADQANPGVPTEKDGRPAKVFIVVTPQTTDAYVGQSIPLRIDFYIRLDVAAQQDSLPTIKGSDFLMNNLSLRPHQEEKIIMNEAYGCDTWITAISAPKSGDLPLQMERDTYWTKSPSSPSIDPFGNFFFSRPNLAHESIGSNKLVVHVHPLPDEGRPANFTGAIGHLKVAASAEPLNVAVGEPVILHFTTSGEGNFDYVRSPSLANDPDWKSYVPKSKIVYAEESHTQGTKFFEQEIVPQKNGTLPLPQASFSYFDPSAKQYVTVPVDLPTITVTGSPLPASPAAPADQADSATAVAAAQASMFLPNRLTLGSLRTNISPLYRATWFWVVQAGLLLAFLLGTFFVLFRRRPKNDLADEEKKLRANSVHQEQTAMSEAVGRGDALAFFTSARHAIQLQLGAQWRVKPEAITLGEIHQRNPQLAETLEPLFAQADEVIYSGRAGSELDLADWERRTRELLQPQPA